MSTSASVSQPKVIHKIKHSSGIGNTTLILLCMICISCIVISIVIAYSAYNVTPPPVPTNTPKQAKALYDLCDSRVNKGVCPILQSTAGNCYAQSSTAGSLIILSATTLDADYNPSILWDSSKNDTKNTVYGVQSVPPYMMNISPSSGNLTINDSNNQIMWQTNSDGIGPFTLKLTPSCKLILNDSQSNTLWNN